MFLFEEGLSILGIRLYAICILIGIVLAAIMGVKEGKKLGVYSDFVYWGVIIIVPIAIIGARLWYILFNLDDTWSLAKIIGLEGGLAGLAIQGGIIAAFIAVYFYCKHGKISVYKIIDIVAPGFFIGQIFGRWGNFFNKELYGPVVQNVAAFKIILPSFITENMYILGKYRHPTFLYESMLNLVGLIIVLVARRKLKKLESGDLVGFYLIWYGMVRIFTESLRMKGSPGDPLMLGPIPVSIAISVLFIILGSLWLVLKRKFGKRELYQDILEEVERNRFDTILFDLDGTLLDTRSLIDHSFIHTFQKFRPEHQLSDEELDSFFGPPLSETFAKYATSEDEKQDMIKEYREFNESHHNKEYIKCYDGCKATLQALHKKGYKLGVVSSKIKRTVIQGLDIYDLSKYFDVIIGCEETSRPKPDPEGINMAIEYLKPKKNVLYVGDNPTDIVAGKNAFVKTCDLIYSTKFAECEELSPDYCIKSLPDLMKILVE